MSSKDSKRIELAWNKLSRSLLIVFERKKEAGDLDQKNLDRPNFLVAQGLFTRALEAIFVDHSLIAQQCAEAGLWRIDLAIQNQENPKGYDPRNSLRLQLFLKNAFQWILHNDFGIHEAFTQACSVLESHLSSKSNFQSGVDQRTYKENLFDLLAYHLCLLEYDESVKKYEKLLPKSDRREKPRVPPVNQLSSELVHLMYFLAKNSTLSRNDKAKDIFLKFYEKILIPPESINDPLLYEYNIYSDDHFVLSIIWGRIFIGLTTPLSCLKATRKVQSMMLGNDSDEH